MIAGCLLCRHCGVRVSTRPRRLCDRCYRDVNIRHKYQVTERGFAGNKYHDPSIIGCSGNGGDRRYRPTRHLPGTAGKIKVMTERAALGLPLCHPGDAGMNKEVGGIGGGLPGGLLPLLGDPYYAVEDEAGELDEVDMVG